MKKIMADQKKIVIVLSSLAIGGTEKEVINIARNINTKRFQTELWLFQKKGEFLKFLPKTVKVIDLKKKNKLSFFRITIQMAILIRKNRPDLLLQFTTNHSGLVSLVANWLSGKKTKVAISIRNLTSKKLELEGRLKQIIAKWVIRFFYNYADNFLVNSMAIRKDLISQFKLSPEKISLIYSTVDRKAIKSMVKEKIGSKIDRNCNLLIIVSRLVEQKRIKLLIKTFSYLPKRLKVRLMIIGSGSKKKKLEDLVNRLEIVDKVIFMGNKKNPYKFMKQAKVLLLGSLIEGCPHVLLEAMELGLVCIVVNYPGAKEIINEENGVLVKSIDPRKIARKVDRLLSNQKRMNKLIKKGKKKVKAYRIKRVIKDYEIWIDQAINV